MYKYAIEKFVAWYCSEPRIAFNRIVVVRYRIHLESCCLAANTINQHLAAVRRLAHEAGDAGLLSPDLAAGIERVKSVKQLGQRSGNWLSQDQSADVLRRARGESLRAKRDYAMLAMLFGCGLRRSELAGLEMDDIQTRQGHWAIVDLMGKGGHVRTVPIPRWVKQALDEWISAAAITKGKIFRAVARVGKVWGSGISENVVWYVVRSCCQRAGLEHIAPHDLRRTCALVRSCATPMVENLSRFSSCWDTRRFGLRNAISAANRISGIPLTTSSTSTRICNHRRPVLALLRHKPGSQKAESAEDVACRSDESNASCGVVQEHPAADKELHRVRKNDLDSPCSDYGFSDS